MLCCNVKHLFNVDCRHGDRTPKEQALSLLSQGIEGAAELTDLGKAQLYDVGNFFRDRYLNNGSSYRLIGLNSTYVISQVAAATPEDNTLFLSSQSFMQGFFPPTVQSQVLANGTNVSVPLGGYQPVFIQAQETTAPDSIWLAGSASCPAYTKAGDVFANSSYFKALIADPAINQFYQKFAPLTQGFIVPSDLNFAKAYNIFDYLNVGSIHNTTIAANLSNDDLYQLRILADRHEFGANYNASDNGTYVAGQTLANVVYNQLDAIVNGSASANKLSCYFSAYPAMTSFFGVAGLLPASIDFYGMAPYGSTLAWEVYKMGNTNDYTVRFSFRNGSDGALNAFPLFNQKTIDIDYPSFKSNMSAISIPNVKTWCTGCGSSASFCQNLGVLSTSSSAAVSTSSDSGLSNVAAGFVGMAVTIAVVLLCGLAFFLIRRYRQNGALASRRRVVAASALTGQTQKSNLEKPSLRSSSGSESV